MLAHFFASPSTEPSSPKTLPDLSAPCPRCTVQAQAQAQRIAELEAQIDELRRASTPTAEPSPVSGRFSSLLYPRRSPVSPSAASNHSQRTSAEDLLEALTREQTLRKEAEGRLSATSKEVEELSATLFEQANEMVADERRARAKLEERVDELEKRDKEKRRRLERLEGAMGRIERVRNLLGESL